MRLLQPRRRPTLDQLRRLYPGQLRLRPSHAAARRRQHSSRRGARSPPRRRAGSGRCTIGCSRRTGRSIAPAIELIARELGLDMVRFRADLDAGTYRAAIAADVSRRARARRSTARRRSSSTAGRCTAASRCACSPTMVDEELAHARASARGAPARPLRRAGRRRQARRRCAARDRRTERIELDPHDRCIASASACPATSSGPTTRRHDRRVERLPVPVLRARRRRCSRRRATSTAIRSGSSIATSRCCFTATRSSPPRPASPPPMQGKFWAFHDQVFAHFGAPDARRSRGLREGRRARPDRVPRRARRSARTTTP